MMKFEIGSAAHWNPKKVLEDYGEALKDFNMTSEIDDDNTWEGTVWIELNTLEDMMKLMEAVKNNIVVSYDTYNDDVDANGRIIIYDDYLG